MNSGLNFFKEKILKENASLLILIVTVIVIMGVANGGRYFSAQNIFSMAYQLPVIGLLSIGMMISILTGGINLSIIATANLNGIVIALVLQFFAGENATAQAGVASILVAILAGFIACCLVSLINGLLIAMLKIPDILVTLGTMTMVGGLNVVLTKGYTLSDFPPFLLSFGNGSVLGIPSAIIVFIVAAVVGNIIGACIFWWVDKYLIFGNEQKH